MPTTHTPRHVWKLRDRTHVSFPDFRRVFAALDRLTERGIRAEYTGRSFGRHWVTFHKK